MGVSTDTGTGGKRAKPDATSEAAHKFAKDQLKAFIERIERLEEEKKTISDDIKEVYGEADATGYNKRAMREIIRMRKEDEKNPDARKAHEALLETYMHALGMI